MSEILIALMQINIALGCLYNGLETGRYRTKLYEVLADAVSSKPDYVDMIDDLESTFTSDSKLSDNHHAVRRWVCELPDVYRKKIPQIEKWHLDGSTSREKLPKKYRWYFGKHIDKAIVWIVCVVVPLLFMWLAYCGIDVFGPCWAIIVLFGQLVPVINIATGLRMIDNARRDVEDRLEEIVGVWEIRERMPRVKSAVEELERKLLHGSDEDE